MKPRKILVVDDEAIIRCVLRRFLAPQGYQVEDAEDGQDALERFHLRDFDILISDLAMPRMSGAELINRAKAEAPGIIVIVLTGHATLDAALDIIKAGCDDILLKPVESMAIIAHTIDRCLKRREAMLLAAAAMRLSKTKGNILTMACEEIMCRLEEFGECLTRLQEATRAGDSAQIEAFAGDLANIHDRLKKSTAEIAAVSCKLQEIEGTGDRQQ